MALAIDRRSWLAGAGALAGLLFARGTCAADASANVVLSTPKLNQVGFRPDSAKRFAINNVEGLPVTYWVESESGRPFFSGSIDPQVYDLTATAGESVVTADFSQFELPGRYVIRVGDQKSHPFDIASNIYGGLVRDAARSFYIIRANAPLDDAVTGIRHGAGHPQDASLTVNGQTRDLTGGWYNAGDYGKWTHMAAISCSEMMWLWELRPAAKSIALSLPEDGGKLPDLLRQARWGLDWLLKMQNPDGSVLHKVDTQPDFAWGKLPEDDPHPRAARGASSIDAGVFIGVISQAARVFAKLDKDFAKTCRAAALKSWTWLKANRDVGHDDPYYVDKDPAQEYLWAACEMALLDGKEKEVATLIPQQGVGLFWLAPQALGVMSIARYGKGPGRDAGIAAFRSAADGYTTISRGDAYGYSAQPQAYIWGSNELALNAAVVCLFAAELTGAANYRNTAQRLLDYVLGCNALDLSFVTGWGTRSTQHPYNWTMRTQNRLMPGWPSGGANGQPDGADPLLAAVIARGTPPAKCFVDACQDNGSWASNEGQTSETAALVLTAGLLGL